VNAKKIGFSTGLLEESGEKVFRVPMLMWVGILGSGRLGRIHYSGEPAGKDAEGVCCFRRLLKLCFLSDTTRHNQEVPDNHNEGASGEYRGGEGRSTGRQ